ncbi:MAG: hypothetical protein RLZZ06_39 [Actinomycetota bacterium]
MLPAAPKDVGRLSDVFTSALASVGGSGENRLKLPKTRHSVVILVDGLGYKNVRKSTAYARFLNSKLTHSIRCEFPSTTATSIAGFATGLRSGSHGLIGYSAFDRSTKELKNLLTGWASSFQAAEYKKLPALSESPGEVEVFAIGPSSYETSGFTELTMKSAKYVSAQSIAERFEKFGRLVRNHQATLSYLYIPELDQLAHRFGVESSQWLEALEDLDREVEKFINDLPGNVGVLLTADHGVLDVSVSNQIYLDEFEWFTESVEYTAGDPRCNFVYLRESAGVNDMRAKLDSSFGASAYICDAEQLIATGWMSASTPAVSGLLPDLYIIWKDAVVAYDRRFAKESHLKMIGQHGAISDQETRVPLIRLGSY